MIQPERQVYYDVAVSAHEDLIKKLKSRKDFSDKKFAPDTENCHFIRYSLIHNGEKVSIVFDTKAQMLTVTAFREALDIVHGIYSEILAKIQKKQNKADKKADKKSKSSNSKTEQSDSTKSNPSDSLSATQPQRRKSNNKVAQKLNTYANDERFVDSVDSTEKHYVNYNYQDLLKTRMNAHTKNTFATQGSIFRAQQRLLESAPEQNQPMLDSRAEVYVDSKVSKGISHKGSATTSAQKSKSTEPNQLKNRSEKHPSDNKSKASSFANQSASNNASKATTQKSANSDLPSTGSGAKSSKNKFSQSEKAQQDSKGKGVWIEGSLDIIAKTDSKGEQLEYKDGYLVRRVTSERVEGIVKQIESMPNIKIIEEGKSKGVAEDIATYSIEGTAKQRVFLRHLIKKKMLQLQGKKSELFGEIQRLISHYDQGKTVSKPTIKEQKSVYKEVKKALPYAFDYMSEQSKIDFTIGLIDIYSDQVKLSDYSVLLVPPYRGLERLIFDLQRAKGIEVKMIGQAYEKEEGSYTLKSGYKKKIDSIVYNETMSALYTEYFEKRNFYAHSNNTDDFSARVISDKTQAKTIFDNLLRIINYNCKKLREISFETNVASPL